MTKNRQQCNSLESAEPITVFEVSKGGTLCVSNYTEAETRADFYDYVASLWSRSQKDLAYAMAECLPLAWAVHSIYSEFRDEIEAELQDAQDAGGGNKRELVDLEARLQAMPEEPEEGAEDWVLSLSTKEFGERLAPEIETWFAEPPDWNTEDDYLPESGTAQGAALEFFRDMPGDALDTLGVDIVEGDRPGSTYYAAELRGDMDRANRAAEAAGIPVRFVAAQD